MRYPLSLLLVLLLACNGKSPTDPTPDPAQPARVSGRIVAADDGSPIAHASLIFREGATAMTDANGRYDIASIPPGLYGVTLRLDGSDRDLGAARLFPGANARDFRVQRSQGCVRPYGVVRDARTGAPLAGATVTFWHSTKTTGADGRFEFEFNCDGVGGSTIYLTASHPGYRTWEVMYRASMMCTCAWDITLERR